MINESAINLIIYKLLDHDIFMISHHQGKNLYGEEKELREREGRE